MTTQTFPAWLRENGYRDATIAQYERHVETLTTAGSHSLARTTLRQYSRGWDALRKYQQATGQPVSEPLPTEPAQTNPRARGSKRRRTARAWPEATWLALLERARAGTEREDLALCVLLSTGMRASDVLRIKRVELDRFLTHGRFSFEAKGGIARDLVPDEGQADDVRALAEAVVASREPNVAAFVAEGDDSTLPAAPGYCRIRRRFLAHCKAEGLAPLHLHDARHTIALRVYERNRNSHPELAVMALLGHSNLQTTMIYLQSLVPGHDAQQSIGVPRRGKR